MCSCDDSGRLNKICTCRTLLRYVHLRLNLINRWPGRQTNFSSSPSEATATSVTLKSLVQAFRLFFARSRKRTSLVKDANQIELSAGQMEAAAGLFYVSSEHKRKDVIGSSLTSDEETWRSFFLCATSMAYFTFDWEPTSALHSEEHFFICSVNLWRRKVRVLRFTSIKD